MPYLSHASNILGSVSFRRSPGAVMNADDIPEKRFRTRRAAFLSTFDGTPPAKAAPRKEKTSRLKALGCCTSRQNSGRRFQPSWYDRPDGKRVKVGSFFASSRPDACDYLRCFADALQRRVLSRKGVGFWRVTARISRARLICMPCPKA